MDWETTSNEPIARSNGLCYSAPYRRWMRRAASEAKGDASSLATPPFFHFHDGAWVRRRPEKRTTEEMRHACTRAPNPPGDRQVLGQAADQNQQIPLSQSQAALAQMLGFKDWHDLEQGLTKPVGSVCVECGSDG